MKRKWTLIVLAIAVIAVTVSLFTCNSCRTIMDKLTGKIAEGTIEYDITYPGLDPNSIVAAGMPNKAYYRFKNNNTITEMEGMMGLVTITFISEYKTKTATERMNLVQKKYAAVLDMKGVNDLNKSFPVKDVKLLSETKEIAGKKCKKVEATLEDGEKVPVYFTKEISVINPNWSNPYKAIDGVLMEFDIARYGIRMHLKAKTVTTEAVDDNVYKTSFEEFKKVPPAEFDNMLQELNPIK